MTDPYSDVRSNEFASLLAQLEVLSVALTAISQISSALNNPKALSEAFDLYGKACDLVKTLRTICRLHTSINTSDTAVLGAQQKVNILEQKVKASSSFLFQKLISVFEKDKRLAGYKTLTTWMKVLQYNNSLNPTSTQKEELNFSHDFYNYVVSQIVEMHPHLTSSMEIEVFSRDGKSKMLAFSNAIAILKNADDRTLRETTFKGMNAWLASHSASFLDILNAITGWRVIENAKQSLLERSLKEERTDRAIYEAMFSAIHQKLPEIRTAVTARKGELGEELKIWDLLSPSPLSFYAKEIPVENASKEIASALREYDPQYSQFITNVIEKGWINSRNYSKRSGVTFADDLPAISEIRISTNYFPTISGQCSLAHLFGAAYQMFVMHSEPFASRCYPLSSTEIMGNLCETILIHHLREKSKTTQKDNNKNSFLAQEKIVLWQELRRITNFLLAIPARHELLKSILEERVSGALSLQRIIELSDLSWDKYFAKITQGSDRYVWAYKPHFYRIQSIFYDWQYTLGFILSHALFNELIKNKSFDLKECYISSGTLSIREIGLKYLNKDLGSTQFWVDAINKILESVKIYESKISSL